MKFRVLFVWLVLCLFMFLFAGSAEARGRGGRCGAAGCTAGSCEAPSFPGKRHRDQCEREARGPIRAWLREGKGPLRWLFRALRRGDCGCG